MKTKGLVIIFLSLFFSFTTTANQKYIKVDPLDLIPEWHCGAEFAGPKPGYCYLAFIDNASGRVVKKIAVEESKIKGNTDAIVSKALRLLDEPGTFGEIDLD